MGLFHRGKKNNDDEPDSVQTNSFSDIMNGLQYAVNCAQDTLQNHQIQNLTRLFEGTNANNANTFQSKKIMVGDKTIDIPLIPQFGITESLIQYKCSVNTPPPHAIRSG